MKHLIAIGAVLALFLGTVAPAPVAALDLKKTINKVKKTVSNTAGGLTGGGGGGENAGSSGGTSSGGGSAGVSASVSKKGIKANVGVGGTKVTIGALNQNGVAQAGAQVGSAQVGATVLSKRQLATLRIDANPPGTGNTPVPGGGGVGGVTPDYARKLMVSLNRSEQQVLEMRCAMILRSPKAFDAELALLCRLVAQM